MNRKQATHVLDARTSVRVYDNGGRTLDRYTVVCIGKVWDDVSNAGECCMLGVCATGHAFSQFTDGQEGRHLGKLVAWDSLPEPLQRHIAHRLDTSDDDGEPADSSQSAGEFVCPYGRGRHCTPEQRCSACTDS